MGDRLGEGEEKEEQPCSAGPSHGRMEGPAVQVAQDIAQDIWGCTHSDSLLGAGEKGGFWG